MTEPRPPASPIDFGRMASSFGRGGEAFFWDFGRELASLARPRPGLVALDVAAGTGAVAAALARAGARVVALDLAAPMLAQLPESAAGPPVVA